MRFYTYKTSYETIEDAMAKGRFFASKDELVAYLEETEKRYCALFLREDGELFECEIIAVDVYVGQRLVFSDGELEDEI